MSTVSLSQIEKTRIWKQFFVLYVPILLLIVVVASWVGYSLISAEIAGLKSGHHFISKFAQRRIAYSLNVTKGHLNGLLQEDEFQHPLTQTSHREIANAFKSLILRNPRYDQVRWIDAAGQEKVRVNHVNGKPVVVPEAQLQNKADRPFFIATMQLPVGHVYVGPIDLNKEHGAIELPYKPVLRLATRLPGQGRADGILVINLLADHLFQAMNDAIERSGVPVYLLNREGYWLHGMQARDNWGFELGKETRLSRTNPVLWQKILQAPEGALENPQGLWNWAWSHAGTVTGDTPDWLALTYTPKQQLTEIRQRIGGAVVALLLPLLALIGLGLYRFLLSQAVSRQRLLEVQRLAAEAELAKRMQSASNVFERVVQASPVGKIIVDEAGRISMVNPRIEDMFGYAQQELLGQPVDFLIPGELRQLHHAHVQAFMEHPKSGRMGLGNTLWGLRKNGSRIPLEIGLTKLGISRETAVMATLTDLSLRYHLIKHNARFESLIKNSSNFIAVIEHTGHIAYINQAGMDMLGLSADDVHALSLQSLVGPASQWLLTDDFMLNLLGPQQADIELSFINRHSPEPVWVSLNVFTITDPDTGETNIGMVGQNQTEKRGMIDALAQSQAHWRNLAEAMPEFVWTCAADGNCDYLNQKWVDYTGIDVASQLGWGWLNQIHPDDQSMLSTLWKKCVASKTALDVEYRIRRHDGQYRWFKTRGVPIYDAAGQISKWYGSNTDIQELKEIQNALSQERNALAIWFDTTPLALWEVNSTQAIAYLVLKVQSGVTDLSQFFRDHPDARATLLSGVKVVDCNPETIRMRHAQSKKGLLGTVLDLCTTPESQEDYTEMILDSFVGKTIRNRQMRAVTKDGQVLHLFLSLTVINKDPKRRRAIVAESDVSEKLQLEAELERYQHHLEALVVERTRQLEQVNYFLHTVTDALPVLIGYWDQDQKCKFANKTYLPLFGRDHAELIGQDMKTVIGPALYAQNIDYIEGALNGVQQRFERAITKADGSIFHSITNYIPDIQQGTVKGFFVLSSDVTEVKEAQLEMERLNQALKERTLQAENASKAKGEFVANMSHEIRTPMNAVIGMTQLLAETPLTEQQFSYLSKIHAASAGLMNILNDILDYSKMEAGRLEVELAELDVDGLLEKVSDLFSISASAKQIELIFEVSASTPKYIVSDALRLTQILNNLIGNAIKFTAQGSVRICVNYQAEPLSEIRFEIIDTGIGMSAEQIGHIFTPFMQADSSMTRRFGGTGLGLSISQHLVSILGGDIGVESVPGQGSRFWFRLPVEVRGKHRHSAIYQALNKRVLVVDDSSESRQALLGYLQQWQISAAMAEDAESGLQCILQAQAEGRPFDLLLLDWKMPNQSGLWLAAQVHRLHQSQTLAHLPVIAMVTAYDVHALVEESRKHPVSVQAILTKPVIPSQLYNLLSDSHIASPLAAGILPRGHLLDQAANTDFSGKRALLVEDNQVNQEVALALLQKVGIEVDVANHGAEALSRFTQQDYDIILMDLHMPVMDGFEATTRIRATEKGRTMPIIALTAAAFGEDKQKAIAAGMSDYLAKPINLAMLAALLSHWLSGVPTAPRAMADTAEETVPVIAGVEVAATMKRLGLSWPQVRGFIHNFASQFEAWPQQVTAALAQQDQETAIRHAHTLKGAALNIGAEGLAAQAAALEQSLKAGDTAQLAGVQQALTQLLAEVRQQLAGRETAADPGAQGGAETVALLDALTPMLAQHRMLPKLLRKQVDVLASHPAFGGQVTMLLASIDRFDFNGAVAIIHALRKELANETESSNGEVHDPDRG